jgi:hypothetical protein
MNAENGSLSTLTKWKLQIQKVALKIEEEEKKIRDLTVDTKTYCTIVGISRPTLIKRRKKGNIPHVTIGAEYRYFLPQKGGQNG